MFNVLTSKIFGGMVVGLALLLGLAIIAYDAKIKIYQSQLEKADRRITNLTLDVTIARANADKLAVGLTQCNASVDAMDTTARTVAANSAAAVTAAQRGRAAVAELSKRLANMPSATCEDAKAILKQGGE